MYRKIAFFTMFVLFALWGFSLVFFSAYVEISSQKEQWSPADIKSVEDIFSDIGMMILGISICIIMLWSFIEKLDLQREQKKTQFVHHFD